MKNFTGTLIYAINGITVHQCADGYTVSNGTDAVVVPTMPQLTEKALAALLPAGKVKVYSQPHDKRASWARQLINDAFTRVLNNKTAI